MKRLLRATTRHEQGLGLHFVDLVVVNAEEILDVRGVHAWAEQGAVVA